MRDLDRAGGDQSSRCEAGGSLGRERSDSGRQEAARPGERAGAGGGSGAERGGRSCRAGTRGRPGTGGMSDVPEQQLLEQHERADRQQRRERLVGLLELYLEDRAALAAAQVAADDRARPARQTLGYLRQLDADLTAGEKSRLR